MSKTTIEWTDYSWNPWVGCIKISTGCKNCYMYREQEQRGIDPTWVRRTKTLNDPLKWNKEIVDGKKKMIFTCSYSDFFIEQADAWRDEAWDIIRRTPNLIYQILTKRIERTLECLPSDWPLANVWLGVTAENQATADERIPQLLQIPAKIHFVSVEPMLEFIDMVPFLSGCPEQVSYRQYVTHDMAMDAGDINLEGQLYSDDEWIQTYPILDWVIVGCESGSNARTMDLDWARSLSGQCELLGVPFFLKQAMIDNKLVKMPELDGKIYDEMPVVEEIHYE